MKRSRDANSEPDKPAKKARGRELVCSVCDKTYRFTSRLLEHQKQHNGAARLKCTKCDKTYQHPRSLQRHLVDHHGGSIYECVACDELFDTHLQYRTHMIMHTPVDPFNHQCPNCMRVFATVYSLHVHANSSTACVGKTLKRDNESSNDTIYIEDDEPTPDVGTLVTVTQPTFDPADVYLATVAAIVISY